MHVVIAAAPIVYGTPTLQMLYEAGMPTGELSLDVYYGLRVTNVYKGTGASLVITGWNSGPSKPEGDELDLTAILNNPAYASYYNATTKVFEKPATAADGCSKHRFAVVARRELRSGQNGSSWIQRPRFHYHRSPGHFAASWPTSLGRGYSVYQLDG